MGLLILVRLPHVHDVLLEEVETFLPHEQARQPQKSIGAYLKALPGVAPIVEFPKAVEIPL